MLIHSCSCVLQLGLETKQSEVLGLCHVVVCAARKKGVSKYGDLRKRAFYFFQGWKWEEALPLAV